MAAAAKVPSGSGQPHCVGGEVEYGASDPPVKAGGSRVLTWAVLPTSRPPVWRRRGRSRHFVLHSVVPAPEIPASSDILEYKAAAAARRAYEDLGAARCRPITSSRLVAGIVGNWSRMADVSKVMSVVFMTTAAWP